MSATLEAIELGKQYRGADSLALREFECEIHPGEIVGLIGPNGAGKSTTINLLGGFIDPTQGSVRRRPGAFGWCPQTTIIDWSLTARENASFVARVQGMSRSESFRRADEALALLGLADVGSRQAETLSGGQLQRVQIARALAFDPELLILDEPTTGLDVEGRAALWQDLLRRRDSGVATLLSSHDLEALGSVADRIIVLRGGRIVFAGSLEEFVRGNVALVRVRPRSSEARLQLEQVAIDLGQELLDDELVVPEAEFRRFASIEDVTVTPHAVSLTEAYLATTEGL